MALRREYARQAQDLSAPNASGAHTTYEHAQQQLAAWRNRHLADIEFAIASVRSFSPDTEMQVNIDPGQAVANAITLATTEVQRLQALDARTQSRNNRLVDLDDALKRNGSRVSELDKEIAFLAVETGPLSLILSELFPHIHDDNCPVCGRDFGEVSKEPLASHVAKHAAELSDQAQRLRALTVEHITLEREGVARQREKETLDAQSSMMKRLRACKTRPRNYKTPCMSWRRSNRQLARALV